MLSISRRQSEYFKVITFPNMRLPLLAALVVTIACNPGETARGDSTKDWADTDGTNHQATLKDDGSVMSDVWTDKDGTKHAKYFDRGIPTQEMIYYGDPVSQWSRCSYENSRMSACTTYANDASGTVLGGTSYTYSDDGRTVVVTYGDGQGNITGQV